MGLLCSAEERGQHGESTYSLLRSRSHFALTGEHHEDVRQVDNLHDQPQRRAVAAGRSVLPQSHLQQQAQLSAAAAVPCAVLPMHLLFGSANGVH